MSILLHGDNDVMTYVVGDEAAMALIAAFLTINQADQRLKALQKQGLQNLVLHNITHPKCPDWINDIVLSDVDYCERKANKLQKRADGVRRQAETLLTEASGLEGMAERWRALAASGKDDADFSPGPTPR